MGRHRHQGRRSRHLPCCRRSREAPGLSASYALAVVVACTVMLGRILVVVGLLNQELAVALILPFALMAVPGAGFAL